MAVGHRVCGQPCSPASASTEAGKGARLRRQGWDGAGPAAASGEGDVRGRCGAWLVRCSWRQAGSRAVRLGWRGEQRRWDGSGSVEHRGKHPGCACPRDARGSTGGWAVREQGEGGRKEKKGNGGRKEKKKRKGERGKRERERRSAGFAATSTTRGGRATRSATRGTRKRKRRDCD